MKERIEKIIKHAEVSEKAIEQYLAEKVKELGGVCLKYVNPGVTGYPDRVCLLPGGLTIWVELKSRGGRLKAIQRARIVQLLKIGHRVYVCDSKPAIDEVLKPYKPVAL